MKKIFIYMLVILSMISCSLETHMEKRWDSETGHYVDVVIFE